MSLFQLREWWSTTTGSPDEDFGTNSLCVANIDNENPPREKLIVASFQGILRVYLPAQRAFKIDDLLLEHNFKQPVLQIEAGKFTSNPYEIALAVLFPRSIGVFLLTGSATGLSIKQAFNNKLERNAFNFTYGGFGGVENRDYLCVQSSDGQLSVFEGENFVFSIQLNDFVIPGPICYNSRIDSLITFNSKMEIEAYRYASLAAFFASNQGKKIQPEWTCIIGDIALEISPHYTTGGKQGDIVVMAEGSLLVLTERGTIRMQKRLDYYPSCLSTYHSMDQNPTNVNSIFSVVGSFSHHLLIYRDAKLLWAAKANFYPIATKVSSFGNMPGLIACLGENGWIQVAYLGTDPPRTHLLSSTKKELNYEQMDAEHGQLIERIIRSENEEREEPTDKLVFRAQVAHAVEGIQEYFDESEGAFAKDANGNILRSSARLSVGYTGNKLKNLNINVVTPPNVVCEQTTLFYASFKGGSTPLNIPLSFLCRGDYFPQTTEIQVVATFMAESSNEYNSEGEPRNTCYSFELPLALFAKVIPPAKSAPCKVTFETNKAPPAMGALFEDVLNSQPDAKALVSNPNAIGFMYPNGVDVTILISKNAYKYRIQSSQFEGLWMITKELTKRLKRAHADDEEKLQFVYTDPIPLQDMFELMDEHFKQRLITIEQNEVLAKRAQQYRIVQKRLLVRFKDKNPTQLNHLDYLLHSSYMQILDCATIIEDAQNQMKMISSRLSLSIELILLLLELRVSLTDEGAEILRNCLSPVIDDDSETGWEEITDASMTHLLRTCLAKNQRENATTTSTLKIPANTENLKKHITIVCDRLSNGYKIAL
eukprot:CAMPEP_0115013974 /NCGR_PEP_ID=MMETSP0216-20121206/25762_1 /TAXON_ID=223996 /ORGANISM="Protocruzia adherens, Strain Boccale" /LENGTH=822 /DNA_ID=CAMNT_0002383545 /DNA_START=48 /DNA_END=2516 /DNA_ORIENTATION=+